MSDPAIDQAVRNQVLLEQYSENEIKEVQKFLKRTEKELLARLRKESGTEFKKARLRSLLKDTRAILKSNLGKAKRRMLENLDELAEISAEFEIKSLQSGIQGNIDLALPSKDQLHAAVFSKPIEGTFLNKYVNDWERSQIEAVQRTITDGFYRGQTTDQIARRIRGTKRANFQDGIIGGQTNRQTTALVRTAINHTATEARLRTMESNSDIIKGWSYVNTLDSRTSQVCASLDTSKVYKVGEGKPPPLHFNCRTTIKYVLKEKYGIKPTRGKTTRASVGADGSRPVPASQSYSTWLKSQPAAFQDQALGKTRGALFRRGKLPIQKFTNSSNEVLTIKQLRQRYPLAFEEANLD